MHRHERETRTGWVVTDTHQPDEKQEQAIKNHGDIPVRSGSRHELVEAANRPNDHDDTIAVWETLFIESITALGGLSSAADVLKQLHDNCVRVTLVNNDISMQPTEGDVMNTLLAANHYAERRVSAAKDQAREQARKQAREELRDELREQAREEIRPEVREEVRKDVREELREEVKAEVQEEVREEMSITGALPDESPGDGPDAPGVGKPHQGRAPVGYEVEDGVLVATDEYPRVRAILARAALDNSDPEGLSQGEAARRLDVSRRTVKRKIENQGELYAL